MASSRLCNLVVVSTLLLDGCGTTTSARYTSGGAILLASAVSLAVGASHDCSSDFLQDLCSTERNVSLGAGALLAVVGAAVLISTATSDSPSTQTGPLPALPPSTPPHASVDASSRAPDAKLTLQADLAARLGRCDEVRKLVRHGDDLHRIDSSVAVEPHIAACL